MDNADSGPGEVGEVPDPLRIPGADEDYEWGAVDNSRDGKPPPAAGRNDARRRWTRLLPDRSSVHREKDSGS